MSEIKQSENEPVLFMISPEKVEFNLDADNISELSSNTEKISKETEMKIINKSEDFIAIKIKTNKQSNYILTPPSLILSPKEEKIIKIRFNRNEGENLELKSHKILFEGFSISPEEKDQDPNELYIKYIKGKIKAVNSITAKTKFFDKNQRNISTISNINISKINNSKISDIKNDKDEIDIFDLTKASNRDIIIALVLALFIGLFILN